MTPRISIIAALGHNRVLGKDNQLLWHIPEDLKRFKTLTLGHPCIMGRKTFESVVTSLGKPLPGRTSVVVTRDPRWNFDGAVAAHSVEDALAKAKELDKEEVFIIGGAQIYEQALLSADRLYLTLVDDEKDGDVFFPEYKSLFTKKLSEEIREFEGLTYRWVDLEK